MNKNTIDHAKEWKDTADIVVVGSGGAGLMVAFAAAEVLVLEKSGKLGGNTSISGGQVWAPNNHHMLEKGIFDSEDAAHAYLEKVVDGATSNDVIDVFVKAIPKVQQKLIL